ncbi:hypothetical protein QAD02_018692 [Eretmocerus hayati]|uniref:Uncharacterized protein n=1 Tax=Eretmocerus hayati TaxID=131215 RepID=A0ACC2PH36_9HYME|nr:hypothetical protein QAD02_018692 [Eretmocerus hayati]
MGAGDGPFAVLGGVDGWRSYSGVVVWCVVLCGSVLLNSTLLVPFIRRPGLRTISNRFVMNLIASNLLAIFVLTSLLITESCVASGLSFTTTPRSCAISEGATALVTTSSILSVLLIGIDQYLAVVDPLRYRTRIDKLKCGLLILAVWMAALLFAMLASLNPDPRTLCPAQVLDDQEEPESESPTDLNFQASFLLDAENATETANLEFDGVIFSLGNETSNPNALFSVGKIGVTYGLLYAVTYALLSYALPFLGICWMYARIYTAARNNFERTRRTGSRPVLSTASFSDEPMGHRTDASCEDFRRIPKISSLSSIDENSESCPSQVAAGQTDENVETTVKSAVIFTLGSSKVEVSKSRSASATPDDQDNAKDNSKSKVPIAELKAKFLNERDQAEPVESARSRFAEVADQRRKSSHDLMYEEMMLGHGKHPYDVADDVNSIRSPSVNFDLGDDLEDSKSESRSTHRRETSSSVGSQPLPIVTVTPPGHRTGSTSTLPRVPSVKSTHSYINNLKHKISNGSLFKYREETRAARISALVIVMGLICWTPYVYVLIMRNLPSSGGVGEAQQHNLSVDAKSLGFLVLATYISPLLFGYRSRRIKRELRKFFCFKKELSYKNNRSLMAKKVLRRRHSGGAGVLGQFVGVNENRWPKDKVQFCQVPDTALAVETCRSSFSSGASTQISSTSTEEC